MTNKLGLSIIRIEERPYSSGAWVTGWIYGYYFNALVFPAHAENPSWEYGESRISKLYLERPRDMQVMYNWDRGLEVPAVGNLSRAAAGCLGEHLADLVFQTEPKHNKSSQFKMKSKRALSRKLQDFVDSIFDDLWQAHIAYCASTPRWLRKHPILRRLFRLRWLTRQYES